MLACPCHPRCPRGSESTTPNAQRAPKSHSVDDANHKGGTRMRGQGAAVAADFHRRGRRSTLHPHVSLLGYGVWAATTRIIPAQKATIICLRTLWSSAARNRRSAVAGTRRDSHRGLFPPARAGEALWGIRGIHGNGRCQFRIAIRVTTAASVVPGRSTFNTHLLIATRGSPRLRGPTSRVREYAPWRRR